MGYVPAGDAAVDGDSGVDEDTGMDEDADDIVEPLADEEVDDIYADDIVEALADDQEGNDFTAGDMIKVTLIDEFPWAKGKVLKNGVPVNDLEVKFNRRFVKYVLAGDAGVDGDAVVS